MSNSILSSICGNTYGASVGWAVSARSSLEAVLPTELTPECRVRRPTLGSGQPITPPPLASRPVPAVGPPGRGGQLATASPAAVAPVRMRARQWRAGAICSRSR